MTLFQIAALFLALIGAAGWVNARLLHWPSATVMVLAGGLNAGVLLLLHRLFPEGGSGRVIAAVVRVDFPQTVLGYMLGFLLFAGAMQVDLSELRRRRLAVWTLATLGVLASTAIVGGGLWLVARLLDLDLSLPWACVFGALISPKTGLARRSPSRNDRRSVELDLTPSGVALLDDLAQRHYEEMLIREPDLSGALRKLRSLKAPRGAT